LNTEKGKTGKVWVIVIIIVLALLVLGLIFFGVRSVLKIFIWLMVALFVLFILGLVGYLVWYIWIRKEKYDVNYVNKKKLTDACKKGNPGILRGLYITGDSKHSRVFWGNITGYCRISILKKVLKMDDKGVPLVVVDEKTKKEEFIYDIDTEEQDVFSVRTGGWLKSLFNDDEVVRVSPDEHNELVGDVDLFGFSLIPISEYWFLNNNYLDVNKIDYAIKNEAWRGIMFEMLRDSKTIIDRASGLDSTHQKSLERNTIDIPMNNPLQK